jgi:predicted SAM-dependent methyltransferase
MNLLNIGCGGHFHEAWTNIDLVSTSPFVRAYDLRKGLPYPDGSFDAVYTSHVLEHLSPETAKASLREQFRVLKSGGIIRVVVPDLEGIVQEYLRQLNAVASGDTNAEANYDWMILEMLDQITRTKTSGQMGDFLLDSRLSNVDFIVSRLGEEIRYWLPQNRKNSAIESISLWQKVRSKSFKWIVQTARLHLAGLAVAVIGGVEAATYFRESIFRNSGEIHRWMYDRFSLARLLCNTGFSDVQICDHVTSRIDSFASYLLDSTPEGKPRKPDSLYMEGQKP